MALHPVAVSKAAKPAPAAAPVNKVNPFYLVIGAGAVLIAADTRAAPLVIAVLIAAMIYQIGQISGGGK